MNRLSVAFAVLISLSLLSKVGGSLAFCCLVVVFLRLSRTSEAKLFLGVGGYEADYTKLMQPNGATGSIF